MKHLLLTTIAAVVLVGCGEAQQSAPAPEAKPEPPTAKAPDISIHEAAGSGGNIEAVKQHLAAGTDVNAKNRDKWTPLHTAASTGRKEIAELLIAKGADVSAKNKYGYTPLHHAVNFGHKEIAELLIAGGVDVNAKAKDGETPLDFTERDPEIAAILRKHGGKHGTIHGAVDGGDIEAVKELLAAGANLNAKKTLLDHTPLDRAIRFNRTEIADLLREHGGKTGEELKAGN